MALVLLVMFAVVGRITKSQVREIVGRGGGQIEDLILNPLPANPLCWSVISVERNGEDYRLRKGIAAPFPETFSAEKCPRFRMDNSTMPRGPASLPEDPHVLWISEWQAKWASIEHLEQSHCGFSAFTHFARAPFAVEMGSSWVVGDARYDIDEDLGFAEFVISREPASHSCPAHVPPWKGALFTE